MIIFETLKIYAGKWTEKETRVFSKEEKDAVESTEVVSSQYGNSVCFHMKSGGMTFIPLSMESTLTVGESIDMDKASIVTLSKQGENDIYRVLA